MQYPLFVLGMCEARTAVVVKFKDFPAGCPDFVIGAVMSLPPLLAAQRCFAKTAVVPHFQDFNNFVAQVTEAKGDWYFYLAT